MGAAPTLVSLATDVSGILPLANQIALSASGPGHSAGYAPDPGATAGTTRYLREDGTWTAPSGGSSLTAGRNISITSNAISENPFDRSSVIVQDSMTPGNAYTGSFGVMGWRGYSGTGGSSYNSTAAEDSDHPTNARCSTGATSGNDCWFTPNYAANSSVNWMLPANVLANSSGWRNWQAQTIVRLNTTTNATLRWQWGNGSAYHNGFNILCTATTGTAYWTFNYWTGSNANNLGLTSTIPCTDGAWHRLQIGQLSAGVWTFAIDSETPQTLSVYIPAIDAGLGTYYTLTTNAAVSASFDLDWFAYQLTGLVR